MAVQRIRGIFVRREQETEFLSQPVRGELPILIRDTGVGADNALRFEPFAELADLHILFGFLGLPRDPGSVVKIERDPRCTRLVPLLQRVLKLLLGATPVPSRRRPESRGHDAKVDVVGGSLIIDDLLRSWPNLGA